MVALTFDDGPRRSTTTEILDALEKYHANATFFCLGIHVEGNESVIERMLSLGCEVSSHSNEHKYLTQLSPAALQKDLTAANEALAKVIGQRPALLRPPFGSKSTSLLAQLDVPVILWSIDTQDWVYHDGVQRSDYQRQKDLEKVVNEALDLVEDGSIILMHDVFFFSADAAAEIIQRLTAQEWQLVTVSELFAAKGIPLEPGKSYYHA
ncbi:MAG: polysaccharide deacetylase family protein [Oscillospiraceae bacterium]|nr:polysaccharide deacetylase family protein [Oscillospiraceae bacterium]